MVREKADAGRAESVEANQLRRLFAEEKTRARARHAVARFLWHPDPASLLIQLHELPEVLCPSDGNSRALRNSVPV